MSSSTFTPSDIMDPSREKDWAANLGMLDWDSTRIVFTKRSLIEFLKYTGTTVDTNFANIQKLPRYAQFGKFATLSDASGATQTGQADPSGAAATHAPEPVSPVRGAGRQHTDIFATDHEDDALSTAPPREQPLAEVITTTPVSSAGPEGQSETQSAIKPSRRVRTNPGGNSSLANLWDPEEAQEFKPTRRVRQGPGGQDSIAGIF